MTNWRRFYLFVVLASLVASCGDDDSSGFGSGLDPDKAILELDEQEALTFCQKRAEYITSLGGTEEINKVRCIEVALLVGDNSMSCMSTLESCTPPVLDPNECVFNARANRDNCNANVGEVEACMKALGDQFLRKLNELTCADDGTEEAEALAAGVLPAACQGRLMELCPVGVNGGGTRIP